MSETKNYFYLRLKENFFDSDSMILLESMKDGYVYANILLKLYLRSLKNEGRLMLNDTIPYNPEMLASVTRHSVGDVEKALKIFKELNLIEILDTGAIYITDIQSFIGKSTTEADRKRVYRERIETEKQELLLINGQMSDKCPDKTPPYKSRVELNINTDIELEKEINKEKENNIPLPKKTKHKYGQYENVLLTDEDLEKLKIEFSDWSERIERLSEYIASKGNAYKDHLATIRSWSRREQKAIPIKPQTEQINRPLSMAEMQKAALELARQKEGRK